MSHRITLRKIHPNVQKLTDMMNSFTASLSVLHVFLNCLQKAQKHLTSINLSSSSRP